LCLFQAMSPEQVRATNEIAQAPYTSIHEAIALL
jgi:hypothetical protein